MHKNISITIVASIALIAVIIMTWTGDKEQTKRMELQNAKEKMCVEAVNEAIPDANDTEARSIFLQNCFIN